METLDTPTYIDRMREDAPWEPVPGFHGYERNRFGEFRSWRKPGPGRYRRDEPVVLVPWSDRDGYLRVNLYDDNRKIKGVSVAATVLEMNVGPRPPGMMVCHFPDRTRTNNDPSNLRWGTQRDNTDDMLKHGTQARGDRHSSRTHPEKMARGPRSGRHTKPWRFPRGAEHYAARHPETRQGIRNGRHKLNESQVEYAFREASITPRPHGTLTRIARELGVTKQTVRGIFVGRLWPHLTARLREQLLPSEPIEGSSAGLGAQNG